jgi:hypothetical protein
LSATPEAGHAPLRLRCVRTNGSVEVRRLPRPWDPTTTPEIAASLNALDRFYARVARQTPWMMRASFAPMGWCAQFWPWAVLRADAFGRVTRQPCRVERG